MQWWKNPKNSVIRGIFNVLCLLLTAYCLLLTTYLRINRNGLLV